jgi:hypothetical protein
MMQQITARVISESNGQPIGGAQVLYQDMNGDWQVIQRADPAGFINTGVPDTSPNIMVAAPGFASRIIDAGEVTDQMKVELKEAPLAGPSLTTVQPNVTPSGIPTWIYVAAGAGLLYVVSQPGKKISGEKQDYSKYILPAGILIAGYFILNKFGLFGSTGTSANNQQTTSSIAAATKKTLTDLAARGIVPTLSPAQAASIANNIFYTGLQVSEGNSGGIADIFGELNTARNDADIYLIMQNFGARQVASSSWSLCSLLNVNCDAIDLDTFVTSILNNFNVPGLTVQDLNDQLHDIGYAFNRGITYTF